MNASKPCESSHGYVVLFLIIPGMNFMAVECAMLIGRIVQETIDRALAGKDLLLDGPPSSRTIIATMQKETATRLNGSMAGAQEPSAPCAPGSESVDEFSASRRFIADVAERLYGEPLLSFVRREDQFYFGFSVSDFQTGQAAVAAEIKRLGFLELAEISHYNTGDKVCRAYHPKKPTSPLTLHCVEVLKGAGLLPQ